MMDRFAASPDKLLGITPIIIAAALPIWRLYLEYGWMQMPFGSAAILYWPIMFSWLFLVIVAIRRHRWWWLLITAPVVLFPIILWMSVIGYCATGHDCTL